MGTPSFDEIQKAKVVMGGLTDYGGGQYRGLLEGLGEFFPNAGDLAWLDQDDPILGQCFTSEAGGWLEPGEDSEFWQLVAGADISEEGCEPPPRLITFLQGLVSRWQGAAHVPAQGDPASTAGIGEPRFDQVGPVQGEGYPGWWQGYDTVDGVWKYVYSGSGQPTDQTPGWATSEVAFAAAQAATQAGAHAGASGAVDIEDSEPDIADLPAPLQEVVARLRALNDDYRDIPISAILDVLNDASSLG